RRPHPVPPRVGACPASHAPAEGVRRHRLVNIVGLSSGYHESACCLLRDGKLIAAAEEERFSRVKHDPRLPLTAWRFCLERGRLGIRDLDALAYYESPT